MPDQHPQPRTLMTRRETLAAERAAATARSTTRARRTPAPVTSRPLAAVAPRPVAPLRTLHSRALAVIPLTGAAAAMALFTAAALPAQAATGPAIAAPGVTSASPAQQFTAGTVTIDAGRDGYTITKPVPKPKPVITRTTPTAGMAAAGLPAAVTTGTIVNTGSGDIRWPVAGPIQISSPFGARSAPCATCSSMHQGVDLTPGAGTLIGAVAAGTVRVSTTHPEYGQYVIIDHQIDGQLVSTLYAHMIFGSSPLRPGDTVTVGQLVGRVGNTGASTGAHLHFQVMPGGVTPINPIPWLIANAGRAL